MEKQKRNKTTKRTRRTKKKAEKGEGERRRFGQQGLRLERKFFGSLS
jgi:hypothetical protein